MKYQIDKNHLFCLVLCPSPLSVDDLDDVRTVGDVEFFDVVHRLISFNKHFYPLKNAKTQDKPGNDTQHKNNGFDFFLSIRCAENFAAVFFDFVPVHKPKKSLSNSDSGDV